VSTVVEPSVNEAKHGGDDEDIKQIAAENSKSFGISFSRSSIRANTPLTLCEFFLRGAEIVASPAIN
jgi:hypothetical protein